LDCLPPRHTLLVEYSRLTRVLLRASALIGIYTLSLHDAFRSPECHKSPRRLPFRRRIPAGGAQKPSHRQRSVLAPGLARRGSGRSEEHTSELQSREKLVCRLLLEKKKKKWQRCPELRSMLAQH